MTHAPRGTWALPSTTWHLGDSNARGRPKRYLELGSWQRARLAMATPPQRSARAQQHFCLYKNICYKYYFFSYNSKYSYQKYYYLCYKYYYFYYNPKYWYKNIIICVIIILEILNIIIYVINIIIFIIINVINKFEKKLLLIL
jgi:hypothetical protein